MTLAQEGYNIMKEMPSRQLKPFIQLLRAIKETNDVKDIEHRMNALAEIDEIRERCSRLLPDDFDPDAELFGTLDPASSQQ